MPSLPHDVEVIPLATHRDERGWLTEIYRQKWPVGVQPCQWNATFSDANVLRGVHVHYKHTDYLVLLRGRSVRRALRCAAEIADASHVVRF